MLLFPSANINMSALMCNVVLELRIASGPIIYSSVHALAGRLQAGVRGTGWPSSVHGFNTVPRSQSAVCSYC